MEKSCKVDKVLDVRGWSCTWSILKAKSELKQMRPGQVLEVLVTDSLTLKDLPPILRESEDEVIGVDEGPEFFSLYVRKGNSRAAKKSVQ